MSDTARWRSEWTIPDDVTYLNHGSFGPSPRSVQQTREEWSARLEAQPMDFFLRRLEPALDEAAATLGRFIGAGPRDLVFVENATAAMNIVAESVLLDPGDEVLLNDHEYGAVRRIWQRACDRRHARVTCATIPTPIGAVDDVIGPLFDAVTPQTKLIVVSHVTSPTAIVFPVEEICRQARERGIPVCIDGPHAIAMRPVNLREIGATFYCASLHKWLSAPFGSGFLHVERAWQSKLVVPELSWGRSLSGRNHRWQDEWNWQGTRDPAPFLAVPAAIAFLEREGIETFRRHGHHLAQIARQRLQALFPDGQPLTADDEAWYGTMVTIPLGDGPSLRTAPNAWDPWQQTLWERHHIEIPFVDWHGRRHIRVSAHLYNTVEDVERLCAALAEIS
ncbi:MAG: aminotransferase class V-fold PLP-dependent enzyme [Planctomycetaceae bacterium]|nr:aminotransferase class V-fold PLP-dependent enzyme [Planctomycetaceae bacterium]